MLRLSIMEINIQLSACPLLAGSASACPPEVPPCRFRKHERLHLDAPSWSGAYDVPSIFNATGSKPWGLTACGLVESAS